MKISELIERLDTPFEDWFDVIPVVESATGGLYSSWHYTPTVAFGLTARPIRQWLCTDTHVGEFAVYLDGEPVAITSRPFRKGSTRVRWLGEDKLRKARTKFFEAMDKNGEFDRDLVDPEADHTAVINEYYGPKFVPPGS